MKTSVQKLNSENQFRLDGRKTRQASDHDVGLDGAPRALEFDGHSRGCPASLKHVMEQVFLHQTSTASPAVSMSSSI
jgi:hypothetical protein